MAQNRSHKCPIINEGTAMYFILINARGSRLNYLEITAKNFACLLWFIFLTNESSIFFHEYVVSVDKMIKANSNFYIFFSQGNNYLVKYEWICKTLQLKHVSEKIYGISTWHNLHVKFNYSYF